jgi:hypothetical protein
MQAIIQMCTSSPLIFGPMREKVTEGRRKLGNEELHNLYSSPNIVGVTKAREMICAGHVARMGELSNACRICLKN